MVSVLFTISCGVATALLLLMFLTLKYPSIGIWPTPGSGTWQSYVFWILFRALNVLCFVMALTDTSTVLNLPFGVHFIAYAVLAGSILLFIYAFRVLGQDNSYGAAGGLVTGGIYRWSRNPQNAMLMIVYAALAIADDGLRTWIVCAAMIAVYAIMVLLEEPWLRASYGKAYSHYCNRVPRFFNVRRASLVIRAALGREFGNSVRPLTVQATR